MAWLQNLAGKAENLLNKIDQNAATVLNDPGFRQRYACLNVLKFQYFFLYDQW